MGESKRRYEARDGVVRTAIVDEESPDRLIVHTEMDVEPVLDSIHRDRELMPHGHNKLAARIPLIVYEDLVHRGIASDEDAFKRWLNSDEAAPWRIYRGRL